MLRNNSQRHNTQPQHRPHTPTWHYMIGNRRTTTQKLFCKRTTPLMLGFFKIKWVCFQGVLSEPCSLESFFLDFWGNPTLVRWEQFEWFESHRFIYKPTNGCTCSVIRSQLSIEIRWSPMVPVHVPIRVNRLGVVGYGTGSNWCDPCHRIQSNGHGLTGAVQGHDPFDWAQHGL